MQQFDLIVIGSGPGGYRAAVLAALRGFSVAIVEKGEWGGCCLNRGCVPKKAWHHTAKLVAAGRGFAGRGIRGTLTPDLEAAWQHQKRVVSTVRASYTDYLKRLGVTTVNGRARFTDPHTLAIEGGSPLEGHNIIIATGSHPYVPANLPLVPGRVLTTDDLFDAPPPPGRRVALIGSGVVGTEFAFILSMLGREVLWLTHAEPLSRTRFSKPALKTLGEGLGKLGIRARTRSRAARAGVTPEGVVVTLPDGSMETVDWLLLGSGRIPHTEGLNLAAAGVGTNAAGFIEVNDFLETAAPHIYAIGDVANPAMTSNHALAEAAVAVANVVATRSRARDGASVPEVVYSALELARVGLGEDQAEDEGREPAVGFAAFEVNPAALGQDEGAGFVRLVADMDNGELLGAEVVGADAGELIQQIAREYGNSDALARIAGTRYNHPTRSEELLNAAETLAARWGLKQQVFGT